MHRQWTGLALVWHTHGDRLLLADAFGTSAASILGRGLDEVLPSTVAAPLAPLCVEALASGSASALLVASDGGGPLAAGTHVVRVLPLRGGALVTVFDDTRTEDGLAAARADLADFIHLVSHDLRAPIRRIDGFVALLQRRMPGITPDLAELFGHVTEGAHDLRLRLEALVGYARVGHRAPPAQQVELDGLVDAELTRLAAEIRAPDVTLERDALPRVWGDEPSLRRLLSVLLDNAVRYRDPERPLSARVQAQPIADGWRVEVVDDGPGIPERYHARIFELFQRGAHTGSAIPGVGAGLAIAGRLARRHGGELGVEAAPGRGSRFWFTIRGQGPG